MFLKIKFNGFRSNISPDSGLCGSITNNIICAHSVHLFCTLLLQGINNFPTSTNRNSTDQNVPMNYNSTDQNVPNYTSSSLNLLPYMVVLGTEPSLYKALKITNI